MMPVKIPSGDPTMIHLSKIPEALSFVVTQCRQPMIASLDKRHAGVLAVHPVACPGVGLNNMEVSQF